jgi:transcriptional regulator with XRE-family HTH domain
MLPILYMGIRETFARNLKARRLALGLSQEELAHRAQLDRTYISSLERCKYGATIDAVADIAAQLGVTPAQLLSEQFEP